MTLNLTKKYYSLDDIKSKTKLSTDEIIHFGATNQIDIYALASNWLVDLYGITTEITPYGPKVKEKIKLLDDPFHITQPVKIYGVALARFEADFDATVEEFYGEPPHGMDYDDFDEYEFKISAISANDNAKNGIQLSKMRLVIFAEDLIKLTYGLEKIEGKPLETRERNSLYSIIAGLSKKSGIDLTNLTHSAETIEEAIAAVGGTLKHEAISKHIKNIPYELKHQTKK